MKICPDKILYLSVAICSGCDIIRTTGKKKAGSDEPAYPYLFLGEKVKKFTSIFWEVFVIWLTEDREL